MQCECECECNKRSSLLFGAIPLEKRKLSLLGMFMSMVGIYQVLMQIPLPEMSAAATSGPTTTTTTTPEERLSSASSDGDGDAAKTREDKDKAVYK